MRKLFFIVICLFVCMPVIAQDKFYVQQKGKDLVIEHTVKRGETVFSLARRYHVPPSMLADFNGVNYQTQLREGSVMEIPVAAFNHIEDAPRNMSDARPIYYKAEDDNVNKIGRNVGVPSRKIEEWNKLPGNKVRKGEELMVGWILYDATDMNREHQQNNIKVKENAVRGDWSTRASNERMERELPEPPREYPRRDSVIIIKRTADTVAALSPDEALYMSQTLNEQRVVTEKGPAVFFPSANKAPKSYYAFHNTVRRGGIIKVHNPGTGQSVFVKVIGAIPATAQYHGAVIGISELAKRDLGVSEKKMFCEISYGVL